jgi:hypothetical protein
MYSHGVAVPNVTFAFYVMVAQTIRIKRTSNFPSVYTKIFHTYFETSVVK